MDATVKKMIEDLDYTIGEAKKTLKEDVVDVQTRVMLLETIRNSTYTKVSVLAGMEGVSNLE